MFKTSLKINKINFNVALYNRVRVRTMKRNIKYFETVHK